MAKGVKGAAKPGLAKPILKWGIVGGLIGFIPIIGPLVSGAMAAREAKRGLPVSFGVGLASGIISILIGILVITASQPIAYAVFEPSYVAAEAAFMHNVGSGPSSIGNPPLMQFWSEVEGVQTILGLEYLSYFILAPIGGLIGGLSVKYGKKRGK
jgi:hypothetical protein